MQVVGYYTDCDTALCADCAPEGFADSDYVQWEGFEGWDEPLAIFDDTESDSVTHCADCGAVIDSALTEEGYRYIGEAVREGFGKGMQNPVTVLWLDEYAQWDDDLQAMDEFYRLLPKDSAWVERDDLVKYARLAGWFT